MTNALRIAVGILAMVAWAPIARAAGPLQFLTSLPLGTRAHDLVIREDGPRVLAYVGTDLGLTIVDVTTATAPVKLGSANVGGKVLGLAVKDQHAYLASIGPDFKVVSVADPTHPVVVATRAIPGYARDVAVKDHVAYVASFAGELYLFDILDPAAPRQLQSIGLPAWRPETTSDAGGLATLNSHAPAGDGKVTGVSVTGNSLFVVECNYGRLYYYDVANAASPVFLGTHYAPFTLLVEGDPVRDAVYMLATFGNSSAVFSAPISMLSPAHSTNDATCPDCGFFKIGATDYGGITVSSNGKYVVYIAGKRGVVQVLDVTDPSTIKDAGSLRIPPHGTKTLETMGVQTRGDHIYTAAGSLGLQVFLYTGLSD